VGTSTQRPGPRRAGQTQPTRSDHGSARDLDDVQCPGGQPPTPAATPGPRPGRAIRGWLRRHHVKATIAEPADQVANRQRKGSAGGRPPAFDKAQYRRRNTVERAVNKLKAFRAVATRYDKRDYMYQATLDVATIKIWLRDLVQRN
jgi:transposase